MMNPETYAREHIPAWDDIDPVIQITILSAIQRAYYAGTTDAYKRFLNALDKSDAA